MLNRLFFLVVMIVVVAVLGGVALAQNEGHLSGLLTNFLVVSVCMV
ncbi:MAG: hypothetical protein CM1200mP25_3630 [Acidobacteriota bacterium]|nr:MAG: hypothetical protein CM1200mP25_3630 [Acidobacteriota bacterium]